MTSTDSLTVSSYQDNPNGTTTNTLSDGSKSTVTLSKNPDGSSTSTEVPLGAPTLTSSPHAPIDATQPIPAAKLGAPSIPTPAPTNSTSAQSSLGAAVDGHANAIYSSQQQAAASAAAAPTTTPAPNANLSSVLTKFLGVSDQLSNKGQRTLDVQKQEGVDQKKKQLDVIDQNILSKTRAYDKQIQAIHSQPGILADVANAKIAEVERQKNSELADLSVQRYAANGDYQTAFDIADKKIKAEFEPLQNELDTLKSYYSMAQNDMSESEKQQAQATIQQKQSEATALLNAKTDALKNAAANQAGGDVMTGIANAKSLDELYTAGGSYVTAPKDPIKVSSGDMLVDPKTGEVIASYGNTGGTDNTTLQAYAQQAAASGQLPTATELKAAGLNAGQVMQAAKELPKQDGTLVDSHTGLKPSNLAMNDTQQAGVVALYDLTKKLDQAQVLFKNMQTSNGTGLVTGTLGKIFPNSDVQAYNTLKGEIVDLLARARSGAALTESEVALYEKKLPGLLNKSAFLGSDGTQSIVNLRSSISGKLDTTLNTFGASLYGYSKVNVGGQTYTVGEKIQSPSGATGTILPDGSISTGAASSSGSGGVSVNIPASSHLSYVNNNPGNLRFAGQSGAQQGQGGFAKFDSPAAGFSALVKQVKTDAGRGLSLASFISKFAPPSENDTTQYIKQVATSLGISPTTPISKVDAVKVAKAMAKKESSSIIG